jgi:hypothetical protein
MRTLKDADPGGRAWESFRFKGVLGTVLGFIAQRAIRGAHRRHMEAFKSFAERQEGTGHRSP